MLLNTHDASAYLAGQYGIRRKPRTLANYRRKGGGPEYHRVSPREVVYSVDALDKYAEQLIGKPIRHTAEEAA